MNEVVVSPEDLRRAAGESEIIAETAGELDLGSTPSYVSSAMPGATSVTSVAEAGEFMDSLSESLGGSVLAFAVALRTSETDYSNTDQTTSVDFQQVTEELGDY